MLCRTSLASSLTAALVSGSLLLGAPACAVVPSGSADAPRQVAQKADSESVLAISIDGMSVAAVRKLGKKQLPNLYRFMKAGASTMNARTEREMTVTLPNHTGMVTGRRIDASKGGHGVTWNDDRLTPNTVQAAAGHDVASVFTAVDAAGGSTALFAAKTKFSLWQRSWPDAIDRTTINDDNAELVDELIADLGQDRDFRFLHLSPPDVAGHAHGWMSKPYLRAVRKADALVGRVVKAVNADPTRKAGTTILLTSDHGGHGANHDNPRLLDDYRIVFMARGSAVGKGLDLYAINPTYKDPGTKRTTYGMKRPPVRNGMIANLALDLLDLPAVDDSEFDVMQDLRLTAAP
ncbi:putative AlkP superfamily pyrophosphatase or phosphodiesterase [Nocardioides sp. BE266]|uniref:alkaline phosphatase family protein n=1 Tax=Nocardioides sp. BE266 TaxID=2817725 RepID=UPI00285BA456|nr:alkaline phosphatase family protein [Nocardioides sp. BE266]MDR7255820.1 putative AlkP superfamily pyrophosphatase or phosphodiesterase [Nocardioides sp. BE266]